MTLALTLPLALSPNPSPSPSPALALALALALTPTLTLTLTLTTQQAAQQALLPPASGGAGAPGGAGALGGAGAPPAPLALTALPASILDVAAALIAQPVGPQTTTFTQTLT